MLSRSAIVLHPRTDKQVGSNKRRPIIQSYLHMSEDMSPRRPIIRGEGIIPHDLVSCDNPFECGTQRGSTGRFRKNLPKRERRTGKRGHPRNGVSPRERALRLKNPPPALNLFFKRTGEPAPALDLFFKRTTHRATQEELIYQTKRRQS